MERGVCRLLRGKKRARKVIWLYIPGWWRIAALACLAIGAAAWIGKNLPLNQAWNSWSLPMSGLVIVVDPGHGGIDGGAVSKDGKILEKDINLAIALLLRDYLQEAGAFVIMTRETDRDLADVPPGQGRQRQDLLRRAKIVNESGADVLISIHMNSVPSSRWRGAQVFYHPSMNDENRRLAALLQKELMESLNNTNRSITPRENVLLLRSVGIPSALVEVGFLSNAEEARLLATEEYQKKVAETLYRGLLRFVSGERADG